MAAINRVEAPPMLVSIEPSGMVTKETIAFYKSFARGGAGIVTVGDSAIDHAKGRLHVGELNVGDDRIIEGLHELTTVVHKFGTKISIELNHHGMLAFAPEGEKTLGPSPAVIKWDNRVIHVEEMTQALIDHVVDQFAGACLRCVQAGFDMVMLHGGHGWLLGQFASPFTNKRTDRYGGSLENRARFAVETLSEIRKRVGSKLAIEYRISADELVPEGMHLEETIQFVKLIEDKIDLLNVSSGFASEPKYARFIRSAYSPYGYNMDYAGNIKKAVRIPVTCVGAITDLEMGEKILAERKSDLVGLGRAMLADPDIVRKSYENNLKDIRPCIRCLACTNCVRYSKPIKCAVNPVIGRELEVDAIAPVREKKRVTIVGGGPAGMETAIIASSRGHRVTLYEKNSHLGGALVYASGPSFKQDIKRYLDYLIEKTFSSGADIHLGTTATAETIRQEKPDVLVLAIGSEPKMPDIQGINQPNVVLASEVDIGNVKAGRTSVVIGAGMTGCETALHLAQQGSRVTIVDIIPESEIATDALMSTRTDLIDLLRQYEVQCKSEVIVKRITTRGIVLCEKEQKQCEVVCDSIVLSTGRIGCDTSSFQGLAPQVFTIGDCSKPGMLMGAIHDGFNAAVSI